MDEPIVRSKIVSYDDMPESIVDDIIDEMGVIPTDFFDVQVVVTVVVIPHST